MLKSKLTLLPTKLFIVALSVCPFLAVTNTFSAGFVLSVSVFVSLIIAEFLALLVKKVFRTSLNTFVILLISSFATTLVQIFVYKLFSSAETVIGAALSCMAVSILSVTSLENMEESEKLKPAFFDGFFNGVYVSLSLMVMSFVRELLGKGTVFTKIDGSMGITLFSTAPLPILSTTAGALMLTALVVAVYELHEENKTKKEKAEQTEQKAGDTNVR